MTEKAAGEVKRSSPTSSARRGAGKDLPALARGGRRLQRLPAQARSRSGVNEKLDDIFEFHGVPVVVDKRSLMYLDGATVDFHDELNRRGFSISNPQAKSTCGCGSSFLDVRRLPASGVASGTECAFASRRPPGANALPRAMTRRRLAQG